ncbi:MAG: SDR family NAD(P)-dependent oxidoreductase, partial [Ornithinimicrobium sp.]|uniref:SDR family NAD(P)-dependent oxidoreductase n=1 Tax=Ornithinimicrobium sp. TaxID=1977084 RepID=UPI003D9B4F86
LHAPIALVRAFLPALTARPGGHIVNVSSLFGLIAPPGQTAYATSKYGLRGFSQALRHELANRDVGVTSVHPGGVRTRIALDSRTGEGLDEQEAKAGREAFDRLLRIDPADAARIILRGVERRRAQVLVGKDAVALDLLERVAPTAGGSLFAAAQRRVERRRSTRRRAPEPNTPGPDRVAPTVNALPGLRTLDAGGTQVRLRVTGADSAEPVLLLHGIGRSLEDWSEQRDLLVAQRVISLDLPGFGHTPVAPGGMSLEVLAETAVATLGALGEQRPVHLTHSSRSRTVAVERSLYADPSLATDARVDRAMALAAVPGRAEAFREALLSVGGVRGVHQPWRDELLARLTAYPVPTLIVWGEQDQVLPAAHLKAAAKALPHARTVLLPDTGHFPQVERPAEFARLVSRLWEAGVPTGAPR